MKKYVLVSTEWVIYYVGTQFNVIAAIIIANEYYLFAEY